MHKHQKIILIKFVTVAAITFIAVVAMIIFKDVVNRSEAMRAMEELSLKVLAYRQEYGSVPAESYIDRTKEKLQGHLRLGNLYYRARWIDFECTADEILAYTEKQYYSLFLGHGVIVLRLDGRVEWMGKEEFKTLLAQQQSPLEIEMTHK